MEQDPYDLSRLVDIQTGAPVGWWPPADGWWFVLAIVVLWTGVWLVWRWNRWRHRRYRRQGLQLINDAMHQAP